MFFGESQVPIHSVLGSCVAITVWHPVRRIGGICHFVLPYEVNGSSPSRADYIADGYFGENAMRYFVEQASAHGTKINEYGAKIFGGSDVVDLPEVSIDSIGTKNIDAAIRFVSESGMQIVARDVGGGGSRKVTFDLSTGDVWVRQLPP